MSVTVKGYAKINLHLDVIGIREDGYHSVETVMQSLSLCDDVTVTALQDKVFVSTCNVEGVPTDEKNIAVRAARLFFERACKNGGARISIEKRIPMAAGLAGGSADAAATLIALNTAFDHPLSDADLCEIGAMLGADVPFCIMCGTYYSDGRGDMLHSFPTLNNDLIFVVACGGEGVSTPWGYKLLDSTFDNFLGYIPKGTELLRKAVENGDKYDFCEHIFNIFEEPVLKQRPTATHISSVLKNCGALCSMMSGSGPSVFAVYKDANKAAVAAEKLRLEGYFATVATPIGKRTQDVVVND